MRRIYTTNPFETERILVNEDLQEVLGFKDRIIKAKDFSGKDHVIEADYAPGFSSDNRIFLYTTSAETLTVANTNAPLLRILERKNSHGHIPHYNIKHLQYIPIEASYLELCRLTLELK